MGSLYLFTVAKLSLLGVVIKLTERRKDKLFFRHAVKSAA